MFTTKPVAILARLTVVDTVAGERPWLSRMLVDVGPNPMPSAPSTIEAQKPAIATTTMSSTGHRSSLSRMRRGLFAGLVIVGIAISGPGAVAAPATSKAKLKLTSPAFEHREEIPDGFTCDGANENPPLAWTNVPKGTVEMAVTLEDPDAPGGTFTHWVAWGIDPTSGALPEAELPDGIIEGEPQYFGPCPPPGEPHRYKFTLYAVDTPIELEGGVSTIDDLRAAIKGNVLGKAKLIGLYATTDDAA